MLHASRTPNDAFIGAKIPCSVYLVQGKPVIQENNKCGFRTLKILKEIPQEELNALFGWKYIEACNPLHPFKITAPPKITNEHIKLLKCWDSVGASVGDSVRDSVEVSVSASTWDSIWASVWDPVRASIWASVEASIWASVRHSVWASVEASVDAYIGSLFPNITEWKYVPKSDGYPFQASVDLWRLGLVPSYDKTTWRLHAGPNAKIVYTISKEELLKT